MNAEPERGRATNPVVSLVLAGVVLTLALAAVWFLVVADEGRARAGRDVAPIDLPVADHADKPYPGSSTAACVTFRLSWNDDPQAARKKLDERLREIVASLRTDNTPEPPRPPLILVAPPRLKYGVFVQAILAGRDQRFLRFNFACLRSPGAREVHYLRFALPGGLPEVDRLKITRVDGKLSYQLNKETAQTTMTPIVERLKGLLDAEARAADRVLLILDPDVDLTLQEFIDVYNALVGIGLKEIALGRPRE